MTSSHPSPPDPAHASFAARLEQKYGAGVDPEISLDHAAAAGPTSGSTELMRRLSSHTLKASRYQLQGEIARGGMGAILKVWDEDLRRTLAMKVILGQSAAPGAGAAVDGTTPVEARVLGRFLEEAQITGQLDHPGITPVHELGLDSDGRVYFTMKLVKGRDLQRIFEFVFAGEQNWSETRALSVLLKVCEALAYAHSKGVIHRDLKPANVMVGNFGEVYVMDWGLARVLSRKDTHDLRLRSGSASAVSSVNTERRAERDEVSDSVLVTMDGDVMGTPAYMSPEQARGEIEKLSARSDVYALGAMLYHLLAQQVPYVPPGARISPRTVLALVLQGPPAALTTLRKDLPAELVAICEKAMSRDAADRYPDTLTLADDLRAYLEHRVVGAYETGTWAETKKWVERNQPLAASVAAGVLALVAGLIVSVSLKRDADANAALAETRRVESEGNELTAKTNAALAEARRVTAEANEQTAKHEKSNVLRLSAFQTLDDLVKESEALWPAVPALVPRYRAWLARAEALVAKLPEFRASLVEIEARALPQTSAERAAERRSHPRFAALEQAQALHLWLSRMLGDARWPAESSVEAELAQEALSTDATALDTLTWSLMDPEKPVRGAEVRALLLARRGLVLANRTERPARLGTLAWALYGVARFDDALAEARRALDETGETKSGEYEKNLATIDAAVQRWRGAGRAERVLERDAAATEVASLEAAVSSRSVWSFAAEDDRWWHAQMEKLVAALTNFADEPGGLMRGISVEHGWGVGRRLDFAAAIEERSTSGREVLEGWSKAIAAIAKSDVYRNSRWPGGARLTPQLGLVPIGPDPHSGLWEFAHLQTGAPARRGAGGELELSPEMGLVFVLLPGGTFPMGAQDTDPSATNFDPQANGDEAPVHEVVLTPYFLSKYEMTQGQWLRFAGNNPSQFAPSSFSPNWERSGKGWTALHPIELVSWFDCTRTLDHLGLLLPTEAEWEFGARGGTTTVYWSGDDEGTLESVANIADAYGIAHGGGSWGSNHQKWDDGHAVHAEVGAFRANAFGLLDVHGNVLEWCRDGWSRYSALKQADPLTAEGGSRTRIYRGGSFRSGASGARSADRSSVTPEGKDSNLGLRPARKIEPALRDQ